MLNAEKYKKRIKELHYRIALCGNELKECGVVKCSDCEFNKYPGTLCAFGRTKWLCSEYKESILTEKEKRILQNFINALTPFNKKVEYVMKVRNPELMNEFYLSIYFDDCDNSITPSYNEKEMFMGMEWKKHYKLEELGL